MYLTEDRLRLHRNLAVIEINNVLRLYREGDSESIGNLLEISEDLPIGNLETDTKNLISIILEQNFIQNKLDVLEKSKLLFEGYYQDAEDYVKRKFHKAEYAASDVIKKSAQDIKDIPKSITAAAQASKDDVVDAYFGTRKESHNANEKPQTDEEIKKQKEELRIKAEEVNTKQRQIEAKQAEEKKLTPQNSFNASPGYKAYGEGRPVEKRPSPPPEKPLNDKIRNAVVGTYNTVKDAGSAVVKNVKDNAYSYGAAGLAAAGVAGLGYMLWKKFSGNSDKAIASLESKKAQCQNDGCIAAYDREIAKVKNKG